MVTELIGTAFLILAMVAFSNVDLNEFNEAKVSTESWCEDPTSSLSKPNLLLFFSKKKNEFPD